MARAGDGPCITDASRAHIRESDGLFVKAALEHDQTLELQPLFLTFLNSGDVPWNSEVQEFGVRPRIQGTEHDYRCFGW